MTNMLTALSVILATAALIGALAYRRLKSVRHWTDEQTRAVYMRPRRADHVWLDITENLN